MSLNYICHTNIFVSTLFTKMEHNYESFRYTGNGMQWDGVT